MSNTDHSWNGTRRCLPRHVCYLVLFEQSHLKSGMRARWRKKSVMRAIFPRLYGFLKTNSTPWFADYVKFPLNTWFKSNETPNFWKQEITALAVPEMSNFDAWWDSMTYGSVPIWYLIRRVIGDSNNMNLKRMWFGFQEKKEYLHS